MPSDSEVFDKAEADLRRMSSELQLTVDEILTILLLVIARDLAVVLPDAFQGLATNYAAFLSPGNGFNDEKLAIYSYIGRISTDLKTFQYVLANLIAKKRSVSGISSTIPSDTLPSAPYVPPFSKKPNPEPIAGLGILLSAATTGTVGVAVSLAASVIVPAGRTVTRVEFYDGSTLLSTDTIAPYTGSYTPSSAGNKALTARAYDDSATPVVSVSNTVNLVVSAPATPTPVVAIAASVLSASVINAALTLSATASISGDTLAGTQFKVNGTNQGSSVTGGTPSISWTPSAKGAYAITATTIGSLGGATASAAKSIQIYDTKLDPNVSGGAGAGCSLGAASGDYILFDNNQSAGGVAQTMNISVSGTQTAAFNYTDTAYAGKPFAYFHSGILYTGTVQGVVNF